MVRLFKYTWRCLIHSLGVAERDIFSGYLLYSASCCPFSSVLVVFTYMY